MLEEIGLPATPINSLQEGIKHADMCSTVSYQFAIESQQADGRSAAEFVKQAAHEGRLVGIPNGCTSDWNPLERRELKEYINLSGTPEDLSFGPDTPDLDRKIVRAQEELCATLNNSFDAHFDPKKPIAMYVGRFDAVQKGVDKFPFIIEALVALGVQVVFIGTLPNNQQLMTQLKAQAEKLKEKGVLVLEDRKTKKGKYLYQGDFGALLRAGCTLCVFPSQYEPFGLVIPESKFHGKVIVATETGGFKDMLSHPSSRQEPFGVGYGTSEDASFEAFPTSRATEDSDIDSSCDTTTFTSPELPDAYLFEKTLDWSSSDQDEKIQEAVTKAADHAHKICNALRSKDEEEKTLYVEQMRRIMREAAKMSWLDTPQKDALPPVLAYEVAYAHALANSRVRIQRGTEYFADLLQRV